MLHERRQPLRPLVLERAQDGADGAAATHEFGERLTERYVAMLAEALRAIKADDKAAALHKEYFDRLEKLGR